MGVVERKERERQEMRERIVEAAAEVFTEEGYEKTSIRSIAERIEYSPGTIYLYFKDKNELLFAVQQVGFDILRQEMLPLTQLTNPRERLREIGKLYVRFSQAHPQHYNLMFVLMAPMEVLEEHKPWHKGKEVFAFLQNTVQECIDQDLIRAISAKDYAFFSWAFLHGLVMLNNTCRVRVMEQTDEENQAMMQRALEEWLRMI